jgi:alpha-glucoside transport system substrate-binding protein
MSRKSLKLFLAVMLVIAAFSTTTALARQAPPGCPEGTWTMMSAELADACAGKLAGTFVSMTGPFTDEDQVKFEQSIADFEAWTGINIQYSGTKQFEAIIRAEVDGGAAPDIADFPQPGLLATFAKAGKVIDVGTFLSADWLKQNYLQSWLDMATMPGADGSPIAAGIFGRYNAKSIVFYPKAAFEAAGYQIPTTWDEMMALSDQIVADGDAPWCVGIESGAATGWPATDWIEDIMLRTTSLENYDNWATPADPATRLHFTDPIVKHAAELLGDVWLKDGYVYGGRAAIASTFFGDAPSPMFEDPPKCYMIKQGSFITSFFPQGTTPDDYGVFYFPPIDPAYGKPFLGGGDIYAMFNDRPEVRAVEDYFTRGLSLKAWLSTGGAFAPQNDVQLDWYGNPTEKQVASLVADATSFRFDGSDLMPGAVGSGTFWKGMTDWISGTIDLDTALKEIDDGWPSS